MLRGFLLSGCVVRVAAVRACGGLRVGGGVGVALSVVARVGSSVVARVGDVRRVLGGRPVASEWDG